MILKRKMKPAHLVVVIILAGLALYLLLMICMKLTLVCACTYPTMMPTGIIP